MSADKSNHSRNPIIPKKKTLGMDGMNEIFISSTLLFNHSGNAGNDWERLGMDGMKGAGND